MTLSNGGGNLTALLSFMEILSWQSAMSVFVQRIGNAVQREYPYQTLLYMSNEAEDTLWQTLRHTHFRTNFILGAVSAAQTTPLLHFDQRHSGAPLWHRFHRALLVIARLDATLERDEPLLQRLWTCLWHNRQSPLVLLLENAASARYVQQILKYCARNSAMQVLALQPALLEAGLYWALNVFPTISAEKRALSAGPLLRDPVQNMHGQELRVATAEAFPKSYLHKNARGEVVLSGYAGKLISVYARRHNATLSFPLGHSLPFHDSSDDAVEFQLVDITSFPTIFNPARNVSFSVNFELFDWCFMVPMERPLPSYWFYIMIFDANTLSLTFLCALLLSLLLAMIAKLQGLAPKHHTHFVLNPNVVKALLGQSFTLSAPQRNARSRALFFVASTVGLIFNNSYTAYLQTYNTHAPTEAPINSMEDLIARGIKIAMYRHDWELVIRRAEFEQYAPHVKIFDDYAEYYAARTSLDTHYAYPISTMWSVIAEQQKFFTRPRFRLTKICLLQKQPTMLPLQCDSPFLPSVNVLIGDLMQAGLIDQWKKHAFVEMLRLGRVQINDPSEREVFVPLKVEDLWLVLGAMLLAELLIFCVFLVELLWPQRRRVLRRLGRWWMGRRKWCLKFKYLKFRK